MPTRRRRASRRPSGPSRFASKFGGKCACGAGFPKGTQIAYQNGCVVGHAGCDFTGVAPSRPAASGLEVFAIFCLGVLEGLDPDFASRANGKGFSRWDSADGHAIVARFSASGQLSARQWGRASRMVGKYHGQIGKAPEGAELDMLFGCYVLAVLEAPNAVKGVVRAVEDFQAWKAAL